MKVYEPVCGTDPKLMRRNNKRDVELSGEPLLIGHKGSSYQTKAAAVGTEDEREDHMKQKKEKDNTRMQNNDRWTNNKESKSMKHGRKRRARSQQS